MFFGVRSEHAIFIAHFKHTAARSSWKRFSMDNFSMNKSNSFGVYFVSVVILSMTPDLDLIIDAASDCCRPLVSAQIIASLENSYFHSAKLSFSDHPLKSNVQLSNLPKERFGVQIQRKPLSNDEFGISLVAQCTKLGEGQLMQKACNTICNAPLGEAERWTPSPFIYEFVFPKCYVMPTSSSGDDAQFFMNVLLQVIAFCYSGLLCCFHLLSLTRIIWGTAVCEQMVDKLPCDSK